MSLRYSASAIQQTDEDGDEQYGDEQWTLMDDNRSQSYLRYTRVWSPRQKGLLDLYPDLDYDPLPSETTETKSLILRGWVMA